MDKMLNRIAYLVIIIPAVYLAMAWKKMPETVALHFNLSGKPDRFGSKDELITASIILILTNLVVYLILTNIYRIDPKKQAAENKGRLHRLAFGLALFLSAVLCLIIYSSTHGNISFNTGLILAATGIFFSFIGNYMHNIKPNYFAGFRLPWTLENEENWRKTHILAGKLWFAGGLLLTVVCLFLAPKTALIFFFAVMIIITIIPIVFSFRLYRKMKSGR